MARKRSKPDNIKEETKILPKEPDAKNEAVEFLRSKGYDAWLENGVVYMACESENTFGEMTKVLKDYGYKHSYGVKRREQ